MKLRNGLMNRRLVLAIIAGILLSGWNWPESVQAQTATQSLTPITFSLDFIVLGRYAPWYTALAKGYYKAAGLDVKIIPAQGTAQSVQALESGIAQFALSDLAGLVTTRGQGSSTARMIAIAYQKAPYAVYSLVSGANITQLKQLEGKEIASGAGSATPQIILGMMKEKGLDTSHVKFTNVDGASRVPLLLAGKIPVIETFILSKPAITKAAGENKVATMLLANQGLKLYSSGILSTDSYLKQHSDVAKAFVRASMLGWRDAMANPEEAAKLMHQQVPTISEDSILTELKVVKDLAVTPDVERKGFGTIDPVQFASGVDFLIKNGSQRGTKPSVDSLYSLDYLPNPPILPAK